MYLFYGARENSLVSVEQLLRYKVAHYGCNYTLNTLLIKLMVIDLIFMKLA